MEFKIGDKVRVKPYDEIPSNVKNRGFGRHAGEEGTVVDILKSAANGCYVYKVLFGGQALPSRTLFTEEALTKASTTSYTFDFDFADTVVTARLYELNGESKTFLAIGHGHIIHDGTIGIVQAASYAIKKIYTKLEESYGKL